VALRFIVGLGNPGSRYERTRHNIGFRAVERLAGDSAAWKDFEGLGRYAKSGELIVGEPMTFMNESGRFVQALGRFFKVAASETLVVFDDVALPLGKLRLRPGGSSGGQKGMQSIIECLSTQDVPRLRLGVGPQPPGMDSADFVLQRFSGAEEKELPKILDAAAGAVELARSQGLEAAMNRVNASPS
jgi:peptidyl-tRNA hydrolase, PTH1 family